MPDHVANHLTDLRAFVVARTFIMNITEGTLNRVGLRTVRRQEHKLKTWMAGDPLDNRFRRVDAIVVTHHIEAREFSRRRPSVNQLQQVNEEPAVLAFCRDCQQFAREVVERACQIVFAVCPRRHDFDLRPLRHPLITDLGEQVNVEFVGEKQGVCGLQPFNYGADAGEFGDPLRVIIPRDVARSLPHITDICQPPPDGFARDGDRALRAELESERLTTPPHPTPPVSGRRTLEQREQRPLQARQTTRRLALCGGVTPPPLATSVSSDHAVHARPRAEEECGNLRWRAPLSAQHQDVEGEQVTIARGAQLAQHLLLFAKWYLKYRFPRHSEFTSDIRLGCTYRCIRKNSSVPISYGLI